MSYENLRMSHEISTTFRQSFRERSERWKVPIRYSFTHEWPRTFDGLELRRVRRKPYDPDSIRNHNAFFRMESGSIHHDQCDGVRFREFPRLSEFFKKNTGNPVRNTRRKKEFSFSGFRTNKTEHIFPFIPGPVFRKGTISSLFPPNPARYSLESDSCLILRPYLYVFPRICHYSFRIRFREFFLKASRSS